MRNKWLPISHLEVKPTTDKISLEFKSPGHYVLPNEAFGNIIKDLTKVK